MTAVKLVYEDEGESRVIRGEIIGEDNIFIEIQRSSDGKKFKINKQKIIKIEENNFISKEGS